MATEKITKRRVDTMQASEELWDNELKGFGVRCRSGHVRTYMLMYRIGGRQRRYAIGRHGALTVDQARKEAKRLLGLVATGVDPASAKERGATLSDVAARFLKLHVKAKLKPRTIGQYERFIIKRIEPKLGKLPIDKIARSHVTDLHQDLAGTPREANFMLAVLSKLMNWAEKHDYRPGGSNPCRHVERFKEGKRERFLSAKEIRRLHKALDEAEAVFIPAAVNAIRLLLFTGARRSEILELEWTMVDREAGVLTLPDSKTGKKEIQLPKPAVELLSRVPRYEGTERVFPGQGKNPPKLDKVWDDIRAKAGLGDDVRIHDLRHSFASTAVAAGLSLPKIGKLLGHLTPQTTARYAHLDRDALRDDVEKIGELLKR